MIELNTRKKHIQVYIFCSVVLQYGYETWTVNKENLESFEIWYYRKMLA